MLGASRRPCCSQRRSAPLHPSPPNTPCGLQHVAGRAALWCRLAAQGAVLQLLASSQIGSIATVVATPANAGRLLGDVLAGGFQVRCPVGICALCWKHLVEK